MAWDLSRLPDETRALALVVAHAVGLDMEPGGRCGHVQLHLGSLCDIGRGGEPCDLGRGAGRDLPGRGPRELVLGDDPAGLDAVGPCRGGDHNRRLVFGRFVVVRGRVSTERRRATGRSDQSQRNEHRRAAAMAGYARHARRLIAQCPPASSSVQLGCPHGCRPLRVFGIAQDRSDPQQAWTGAPRGLKGGRQPPSTSPLMRCQVVRGPEVPRSS